MNGLNPHELKTLARIKELVRADDTMAAYKLGKSFLKHKTRKPIRQAAMQTVPGWVNISNSFAEGKYPTKETTQ